MSEIRQVVVRIVQLDAPSERIIGPFDQDVDAVRMTAEGDPVSEWIKNNRTDKWTMIQIMPLERPNLAQA
jgi:hypothetical protein